MIASEKLAFPSNFRSVLRSRRAPRTSPASPRRRSTPSATWPRAAARPSSAPSTQCPNGHPRCDQGDRPRTRRLGDRRPGIRVTAPQQENLDRQARKLGLQARRGKTEPNAVNRLGTCYSRACTGASLRLGRGSNGGLCLRRLGLELATGGVKRPFARWRAVAARDVEPENSGSNSSRHHKTTKRKTQCCQSLRHLLLKRALLQSPAIW